MLQPSPRSHLLLCCCWYLSLELLQWHSKYWSNKTGITLLVEYSWNTLNIPLRASGFVLVWLESFSLARFSASSLVRRLSLHKKPCWHLSEVSISVQQLLMLRLNIWRDSNQRCDLFSIDLTFWYYVFKVSSSFPRIDVPSLTLYFLPCDLLLERFAVKSIESLLSWTLLKDSNFYVCRH